MRWFDEMQQEGLKPNSYTFQALMATFEISKQWKKAQEVFDSMKSADVKPDTMMYQSLISSLEAADEWERAGQSAAEMYAWQRKVYNESCSVDNRRNTVERR